MIWAHARNFHMHFKGFLKARVIRKLVVGDLRRYGGPLRQISWTLGDQFNYNQRPSTRERRTQANQEHNVNSSLADILGKQMRSIKADGLFKLERELLSAQGPQIQVSQGEVINFCANNYLGLSSHPEIVNAAHRGLDERGFGLSSVRFICGTQDVHRELERGIAEFLAMEDAILYSSCFDANGGLFETILTEQDVVISDALNHASIIDGIRLSKAARKVYKHADIKDLEERLIESAEYRIKLIATDGVFSMDGDFAPLDKICEAAQKRGAVLMVDDSHATGFVGPTGRGTPELFEVWDQIDIITSTMGKALGGASGGFTAGSKEVIEFLRQRSRPYLFSNSVAPPIVYASLKALDLISHADDLRLRLAENTKVFRMEMKRLGFDINESSHPIVPVMLGEARLAQEMAAQLLNEGIYVVGFSYPVVPKGKARIRTQISAAHTADHLQTALRAFETVGKRLNVIS